VPWEGNPILTQRHLDRNRKNPVTTTGHADLVQTQNGDWYAIYLGCRPYEGEHYNIGRETYLNPVTWTPDGWPVILKGTEQVQFRYPLPAPNVNKKPVNPYSGNFTFRDDFGKGPMDFRYIFLRTVTDKWYNKTDKAGRLSLKLRPPTVIDRDNPSFVGFRQQHNTASATTKLEFIPGAEKEKAGMVIFQNEEHFYYLCKSLADGKPVVQLYRSSKDSMMLLASQSLTSVKQDVYLRIQPKKSIYTLSFSTDGKKWEVLKDVDSKFLSTETAGGFVGSVLGMYATSMGKQSTAKAYYDWFEYTGADDIFK
jgi:alpha-N-arabinofuranosidase